MGLGVVVGVGLSILAPKAWAKMQGAWHATSDWITRPRDRDEDDRP